MNPSGFERSVLWCVVQHLFNLVVPVDLQIVMLRFLIRQTLTLMICPWWKFRIATCDLPGCCFSVCKLWQAREQRQKKKAKPLVPWPGTLQVRFGTGCISSEWHDGFISVGFHWILILSLNSSGLKVMQNQRADVLEDDMPLAMFQAQTPHSPQKFLCLSSSKLLGTSSANYALWWIMRLAGCTWNS